VTYDRRPLHSRKRKWNTDDTRAKREEKLEARLNEKRVAPVEDKKSV